MKDNKGLKDVKKAVNKIKNGFILGYDAKEDRVILANCSMNLIRMLGILEHTKSLILDKIKTSDNLEG